MTSSQNLREGSAARALRLALTALLIFGVSSCEQPTAARVAVGSSPGRVGDLTTIYGAGGMDCAYAIIIYPGDVCDFGQGGVASSRLQSIWATCRSM